MWSTFLCYETKSPIEVDANVARSIEDIVMMSKRSQSSLNN